jgi:perosamine synthetase
MITPLFRPPDLSAIGDVVNQVLASGHIATGPNVELFEALLRNYLGNPWVTSTGDVSTSLSLCLFQAGVRPGDDVLMSPLVCLSTSCPVLNLFANIRWCDVDPMTGNLAPAGLAARITPRTKAIVVYHWAGTPADIDAIRDVARSHKLALIEDAGEALGAEYNGHKIGAAGADYTVFSFYPNRHLTTIDGGAIACAAEHDFEKLRWLKRYGIHQPSFRDKDGEIDPASDIPMAGWNSYMNEVAATVGIAQMGRLPSVIARHQANGLFYDARLANVPGITLLTRHPKSRSAHWVYTFLIEGRDHILKRLRQQGIQASKVHLRNDVYTGFGGDRLVLSGVDYFASRCLSIPCGWWVGEEDRSRISDIICRELASV